MKLSMKQIDGLLNALAERVEADTTKTRASLLFATSSETLLTDSHYLVVVKLTVPGPSKVTLPASPAQGKIYIIKDGTGDAMTNNIEVDGNGKLIDGLSKLVLAQDFVSVTLIYNGTAWNIV